MSSALSRTADSPASPETPSELPSHSPGPSALQLSLLLGVMVVCWALNFIVSKVALRELPPVLVAGIRTATAGLLMLPIFAWQRSREPRNTPTWDRADLPMLLFLGLCGVALNQLFFVFGMSRTSVAHAAIMIAMTPIFVLLLAVARRQERLTVWRLLGLLICMGGVIVLQAAPSKGNATPTLLGDLLILGASITFALFTVLGKEFTRRCGSITVNTVAYVGGGLMLLPLTTWGLLHGPPGAVSMTAWASVLYMAVFPSVVCYLIYYYALAHIPASRVSSLSYLQPVLATTLAVPLLGEPVTAALGLGGLLVLTGLIVAGRS